MEKISKSQEQNKKVETQIDGFDSRMALMRDMVEINRDENFSRAGISVKFNDKDGEEIVLKRETKELDAEGKEIIKTEVIDPSTTDVFEEIYHLKELETDIREYLETNCPGGEGHTPKHTI